jgi:preprotein translocase subunit SecG
MSFVIGLLTFVLILTSLFLVLVVLMQPAKADGGMGAVMGGGSMESTFGADTSNVLGRATIRATILFFIVSFALYMSHVYQAKHHAAVDSRLPTVVAPLVPAPAAQPATTPKPVEPKKP